MILPPPTTLVRPYQAPSVNMYTHPIRSIVRHYYKHLNYIMILLTVYHLYIIDINYTIIIYDYIFPANIINNDSSLVSMTCASLCFTDNFQKCLKFIISIIIYFVSINIIVITMIDYIRIIFI